MLRTVAFEMVPPNTDMADRASEEGYKLAEHSRISGLDEHIRHVMIPGIIAEDDGRPVEMKPKMDPLEFWHAIRPEVGNLGGLCTQVTAFHNRTQLTERLHDLGDAGIEGVTFVGVPRSMGDGDGPGLAPTDALDEFRETVDHRGAILIPTRDAEADRFSAKCARGATFGMTQMLYSDAIVTFLRQFAQQSEHRPEIFLSFGYVPAAEDHVKLIDWLIQDPGNPAVQAEQAFVADIARSAPGVRRKKQVDLYKRIVDEVIALDFPISIHFEAPYGISKAAFETFAEMLDYWAPQSQDSGSR